MNWITDGIDSSKFKNNGWSIPISIIIIDNERTLDPKRLSKKYLSLLDDIKSKPHFKLTEALNVIPKSKSFSGHKVKADPSKIYGYVEIQDMGFGEYQFTELRGWELPSRAKHFAETGDIYIGSIWGSIAKWFMADESINGLVVTNGCYRLRVVEMQDERLIDLIAFFVAMPMRHK